MIQSFRCDETREVFEGVRPRRLPGNLLAVMQRKLKMLDAAVKLEELRVPPGNRLEALKGGRRGQHSIRVNDQCRVCFRWQTDGPHDVAIVDYH
ncbi:MAG: type II toxin-antitoxin system RelE/ParE family toxin [Methylacidiphilales bacterium]|nr:type II toxin-antitoxin system RelE/ParE family toxin [Candidatus Methylacidiphilales bacterium]